MREDVAYRWLGTKLELLKSCAKPLICNISPHFLKPCSVIDIICFGCYKTSRCRHVILRHVFPQQKDYEIQKICNKNGHWIKDVPQLRPIYVCGSITLKSVILSWNCTSYSNGVYFHQFGVYLYGNDKIHHNFSCLKYMVTNTYILQCNN